MSAPSQSLPLTVVFFEEANIRMALAPLSLTRLLCDLQVGALTLKDLVHTECQRLKIKEALPTSHNLSSPHILPTYAHSAQSTEATLERLRIKLSRLHTPPSSSQVTLYLNASLSPNPDWIRTLLKAALTIVRDGIVRDGVGRDPLSLFTSQKTTPHLLALLSSTPLPSHQALDKFFNATNPPASSLSLPVKWRELVENLPTLPIIEELHDLLNAHETLLAPQLQDIIHQDTLPPHPPLIEIAPHVWAPRKTKTIDDPATPSPEIHPSVSYNASKDRPIVFDHKSKVGAYSLISGPLYLGPESEISPHSHVAHTATGQGVRLGGEIHSSMLYHFSNKKHFGFLGHSVIGAWVNLGAGTTTSNLKANYQPARLYRADGSATSTQRLFVGAFIGDYAKTAIHIAIYGGRLIGVAAQGLAAITRNIPAFALHKEKSSATPETRISLDDVFITHQTMFARRKQVFSDDHAELLRLLFEKEN